MKRKNTRDLLCDSLCELMAHTPLNDITIDDIVQNCQYSRRTFYYYFSDKYELLNYLCEQKLKNYIQGHTSLIDHYSTTLNLLIYIQENKNLFSHAISYTGQNNLKESFYKEIKQSILDWVQSADLSESLSDETTEFLIDFWTHGSTEIVYRWIASNCAMPPQEMARKLLMCLPEKMKSWFYIKEFPFYP